MNAEGYVRAACLTSPVPGGVAVVQVVGTGAPVLVNSLLQSSKPLSLNEQAADRLCFCRLIDEGRILDDVVVTVRSEAADGSVVDISLHGGPRVVQRLLMLLKRRGAEIVPPAELMKYTWPPRCLIEVEGLEALMKAKSRPVALWLAHSMEQLPRKIEQLEEDIKSGQLDRVRNLLAEIGASAAYYRYLLEGVRVVLVGDPNSGKSTLANTLAEREQAIVSDLPGTTRDWVQHPAAIRGLPFIFVDTAGLRESEDPVEQEAVRRARRQVQSADIVLQVMDGAISPSERTSQDWVLPAQTGKSGESCRAWLWVWNKSDQGIDSSWQTYIDQAGSRYVLVSALTGEGLENLGNKLIEAAGMGFWRQDCPGIFTKRQVKACASVLSAINNDKPNLGGACYWLRCLKFGAFSPEESSL